MNYQWSIYEKNYTKKKGIIMPMTAEGEPKPLAMKVSGNFSKHKYLVLNVFAIVIRVTK